MSRRLEITADIVASVVRPLVEPGVAVTRGQALLIVESMKMEIPVVAPEAGIVTSLDVAAGEVVEEGDLLATIEAGSGSPGTGPAPSAREA